MRFPTLFADWDQEMLLENATRASVAQLEGVLLWKLVDSGPGADAFLKTSFNDLMD